MTHPIVERELFSFLRTRRALALQVALAAAFSLLVVLRWPTDARVGLSGTRSLEVFRVFGYGLLAAMLLLGPIFPATSLVRERLRGTLSLLLCSPMRPWSIYLGKLCGVLGLVLLLLAMSLPAAAACYAMGGVSLTGDLLGLYLLLLLVAVQYTALALLVSSYANSIDSAVRITYGVVLALAVLTLGPHQFLQGEARLFAAIAELVPFLSGHGELMQTFDGFLASAAEWFRCLSPISALMELLGQKDVAAQGMPTAGAVAARYAVFAILSTAGMMIWTVARLNRYLLDRPRPQGKIADEMDTAARVFRRLWFLIDPRRRKPGIPWFVNPVMVKEFRTRRFGRFHWLLRMVAVCAVLSLLLTVLTTTGTMSWGVETIGAIMVVLQVALIVLVAPSLAAGLISTERESGGWDLLRMTPLSTWRILVGKLFSVVWPLALIMLATLPGYAVMVYIQPSVTPQVQRVMVCLLLTALFGIAVSAAVSSLFRQTAAATVTAYSLLLSVYAGTMLVWLGRDFPFSHSTVEAALVINPMAAAFSVIEVAGFDQYDLVPANWWFIGIASGVLFAVLIARTWRLTRPT